MTGDLHCHTRLSDGSMGIDDVVFHAKRAGLSFLSITDHDTLDGVGRAAVLGRRYGVQIIPGVELSCRDLLRHHQARILCYLPQKPDRLQGLMRKNREEQRRAASVMLGAVMRSYPITEAHVLRNATGSKSLYPAHIMQTLVDLGYDNCTHGQLYHKLLSPSGGCCYHEPRFPDIYTVLDMVHEAGGLAVLAFSRGEGHLDLLEELAQKGLLHGTETYCPQVNQNLQDKILELAVRYGLFHTGGSGFHGGWSEKPQPLSSGVTCEKDIIALLEQKRLLAAV